jgi:hypothetical protein
MKTQTCFKFPETTYINDRIMAIMTSRGKKQKINGTSYTSIFIN